MNHIELEPYPFPDGLTIPLLMPFQAYPWNGDGYLAAEVLRLKDAHRLTQAFETGMCLASSTLFLCEHFDAVVTCEVNPAFGNIGMDRLGDRKHVSVFMQESTKMLQPNTFLVASKTGRPVSDKTLCFLDAHWGPNCPLLDELTLIGKSGVKPCIIIHDFVVPGTDFGFDSMPDGRPFNLELIMPCLDAIYGERGWLHSYPTKAEGARRGWISIEPV